MQINFVQNKRVLFRYIDVRFDKHMFSWQQCHRKIMPTLSFVQVMQMKFVVIDFVEIHECWI